MHYEVAISGTRKTICVFSEETLEPGERVWINWRGNTVKCYVLGSSTSWGDSFTVKERDGKSFLSEKHVEIAKWVSRRFGSPIGMVFDLFFPPGLDDYRTEKVVSQSPLLDFEEMTLSDFVKSRGEKTLKEMLKRGLVKLEKGFYIKEPRPRLKKRVFLRASISGLLQKPLTLKQKMVVEYLQFNNGAPLEDLLKDLEISKSVIEALQEKGIIEVLHQDVPPKKRLHRTTFEGELSSTNLFFGPAGSGKTEALLELAGDYSRKGTVLFLVPEVSILMHLLSRLKGLFPRMKTGIYHSYLPKARKNLEWYRAVEGKIDVLLGTRSAVFVPIKNLSLVIVDEEHDESLYQYSSPSYDAVEVAREISKIFGVPLVLSSATPDLKTYREVKEGKIKMFSFVRKHADISIEVVDMREEEKIGSFAKRTLDRMEETLKKGRRVLVYVRRKGYWGRVQCETCGYVLKCKDCDVSLVYHLDSNSLKCHQCGREYKLLEGCPICGGRLSGRGAGTEKIERELQRYFPDRRVKRIDREVVEDIMEVENYINKLISGEIDILVGTRMITKSFDVPEIGLVCVLDVDSLIFLPDFSASLRAFQLIVQVFGRASRRGTGKAVLQTYNPDEEVIVRAIKEDVEGFYGKELERRKILGYPPYRHLIHVALRSKDPDQGKKLLMTLKESLAGEEVLGPVEHWVFKLKGFYRHHLVVKTSDAEATLSKVEKFSRVLGLNPVVLVDPPSLEIPD
ncbi:primosomal protein N' [Thermotoga sp.]|uniref:replication restart helicase PriA n=1 Tax=Thermotoga sp. TaxID=28240 RepID=UPI0025FDC753|nr:primosomal protein N' [Thermotoga sp.]MCD6551795.1 primosomal protein N' [Thermotoga sp.]